MLGGKAADGSAWQAAVVEGLCMPSILGQDSTVISMGSILFVLEMAQKSGTSSNLDASPPLLVLLVPVNSPVGR